MRKRQNNHTFLLAGLMLALFAGAGCKKKEQQSPPATSPPPQQTTRAQVALQKQPTSAKVSGSIAPQFDFSSKKDPFKPFITAEPAAPKAALPVAKGAEVLPIQRYEVDKFKVSGIIVGLKENKALIVDPTGKGYVVKQGMLLGSNNGRITRITSSSIEVAEQFREDTGHIRKRTVRLTLPPKK